MPFTLIIHALEGEETERQFDQANVSIGRGAGSDLVLKDPQRMISSRHAEIRKTANTWSLVDIGSTNGTKLNDLPLSPHREYPLGNGDRIAIGPARLTFQTSKASPRQRSEGMPSSSIATSDDLSRWLYLLRRVYAGEVSLQHTPTPAGIDAILRQTIGGLPQSKAAELLTSLREDLSPQARSVSTKHTSQPEITSPPVSPGRTPIRDESSPDLLELVRHFCGESDHPLSKKELEHIIQRVIRILEIVCTGLADAVKGRREFQRELEVEATRIFSWKHNPIKQAENAEEIGALLLNPARRGLDDEQVADNLKEIFQDLTLHQLGLMAGFRECVKGLLKELDPSVLAKAQKAGEGKGIGLLGGGSLRQEAAAWRRFVERHRQLSEEEVRVFERILAPYFSKGYLSVHKARRQR